MSKYEAWWKVTNRHNKHLPWKRRFYWWYSFKKAAVIRNIKYYLGLGK